jgi:transcriptional regulator with PAS, ATPase and Fis domain
MGKKIKSLSTDFLQALKLHQWPGNTRELKNVIERSVILSTSDELTIETLPQELRDNLTQTTKSDRQFSAFELVSAEKLHIQKVLNYTNGNKTETARLLNIALTTLYRKIDEYRL